MKNSVDSGKIGLLHCEDTISRENRLVSRTETGCEYHFYTLGSNPCFSKVDILRRVPPLTKSDKYSTFSISHLPPICQEGRENFVGKILYFGLILVQIKQSGEIKEESP